jgi:hypothetical protein
VSHAADPHEAETADHEAGDAHAVEASDELAPDEPKTPLWLTALGGGLFLLLAIGWLAARSVESQEGDQAAAAASASASAVAAPAIPAPAVAPPPPAPPAPPPGPAPAVGPAATRQDMPTLRLPKRGKTPKPDK